MTYKTVNGKLVNTSKGWGGYGLKNKEWRNDMIPQSTPPEWHPAHKRFIRGMNKGRK